MTRSKLEYYESTFAHEARMRNDFLLVNCINFMMTPADKIMTASTWEYDAGMQHQPDMSDWPKTKHRVTSIFSQDLAIHNRIFSHH